METVDRRGDPAPPTPNAHCPVQEEVEYIYARRNDRGL